MKICCCPKARIKAVPSKVSEKWEKMGDLQTFFATVAAVFWRKKNYLQRFWDSNSTGMFLLVNSANLSTSLQPAPIPKTTSCHQSSLSHHASSSTRFVSAAAKREYKSSASRGTQAVRESPPQAMEGKSCTNLAWWLSHGFVGKNKQSQGGSGPFKGALKHHHNQLLTSS